MEAMSAPDLAQDSAAAPSVRTAVVARSTSIRVAVPTRDALARQAAGLQMSLAGYLDRLARQADRERVFADFRADALQAYQDEAFLADLRQWDQMDDGIRFDGDAPTARDTSDD